MTQAPTTPTAPEDNPAGVLAAARAERAAADRAEARILALAVEWAAMHSAESLADATSWSASYFGDSPVAIAGPGAPLVNEFAVAELAAALGLPTEAGRSLIGEAVELRHRLPLTWARVGAGDLPAWRARRIARATLCLSPDAATFVDERVASFAHRVGPAVVDRLVEEALARFDPADLEVRRHKAAQHRHVTVDLRELSATGTVQLYGELDLADGLDLDHVLDQRATQLASLGSVDSRDERRATALGELARGCHPLAFTNHPEAQTPAARELVLHVHMSGAALPGPTSGPEFARVEETRSFVTTEQVQEWCGAAGSKVTVRPVVDLTEAIRVDAYEIPDRLAEQVRLRDSTCVFPWCRRSARACDLDHLIPYLKDGPPGQTSTANLAALCRRHHRLKTFGGWRYHRAGPATYEWTSPHGHRYLRDHTGTVPLDGPSELPADAEVPDT